MYGLLPHEQKISVMHFVIKRNHDNNEPIRSKERMIFHVGYRRFAACPVYSQHTNAEKHKVRTPHAKFKPRVLTLWLTNIWKVVGGGRDGHYVFVFYWLCAKSGGLHVE